MKIIIESGSPISMDDAFCDWVRRQDVAPENCFKTIIDTTEFTVEAHCFKTRERNGKQEKYVVSEVGHPQYGQAAIEEPRVIEYVGEPPSMIAHRRAE